MLANVAVGLVGQVIGLFGEKGKAQQSQLKERVANMQRSYTDELIAAVWFSPLVVMWFQPAKAAIWIDTAFNTSEMYTGLLVAITAAVFGLGKVNGKK